MTEKRFTIKKSGKGLFYSDGDYSIDNTIQFVIETVESKLNQLNDENNELKSRVCECHTFLSSKTRIIENSNEELRKENEQLKEETILLKRELDDASKLLDGLTIPELLELVKSLNEENQALQRHIKRSTFNKIRVEDVFNCAKYDKFYDNEEAIKSIDWIAKELGVDYE